MVTQREPILFGSILAFIDSVDTTNVGALSNQGDSGVDNAIHSTGIIEVVTRRARRSRNRRRRIRVNRNQSSNANTRACPARNTQVLPFTASQVSWIEGRLPHPTNSFTLEGVSPRERALWRRSWRRRIPVATQVNNVGSRSIRVERQRNALVVVSPYVENQPLFSNIAVYKREVSIPSTVSSSISSVSSPPSSHHSYPSHHSDPSDHDGSGFGGGGGGSGPPSMVGSIIEPDLEDVVIEDVMLRPVENVVPRSSWFDWFHDFKRDLLVNSSILRLLCCTNGAMLDVAEELQLRESEVRRCVLLQNRNCIDSSLDQCITDIEVATGYNMRVLERNRDDDIARPHFYAPRLAMNIPRFTAAMFLYLRTKHANLQRTDANVLIVKKEYLRKCAKLNMRDVDIVSHQECTIEAYFSERSTDSIAQSHTAIPKWLRRSQRFVAYANAA